MPNFLNFKPAKVSKGKCCFIYYYVINPFTNKMERIRIKLNHIPKNEQKKYSLMLIYELNSKLYGGYNPFLEKKDTKCITLVDAINLFMENTKKNTRKDTIRSYNSYCAFLLNFIKNRNLQKLLVFQFSSEPTIKILKTIEDFKNVTYNNYVKFYKMLWNWMINKKYTQENPFSEIKLKRKEQKLREFIPEIVRSQIKKYLFDTRFYAFYFFCQFTYKMLIRPSESFKLKIGDIDYNNNLIILRADDAKDHENRVYAIPDEIMNYLKNIQTLPKDYHIFSNDYNPGKVQKDSRYSGRTWDNMRTEIGFSKKYTFYSLKDTGITELLNSGVPARIVQQLAGHSSIEMTEKYAHKMKANEILQYNNLKF
jgi:integrase